MTPSPEAREIAAKWIFTTDCSYTDLAGLIDDTLAPYREQVRRLVEAARRAREDLATVAEDSATSYERGALVRSGRYAKDVDAIHAKLDAALEPFTTTEKT